MTKTIIASCLLGAMAVAAIQGAMRSNVSASQAQALPDAAVRELQRVGITLADAVMRRDIETILKHDRPDLRASDREELKESRSELSCFLFERDCNPQRRRSVRDIIAGAKQLDVRVRVLRTPSGAPHGLLLFFDARDVNRTLLGSAQYLCTLSRRGRLASWLFKWDVEHWTSAHPPFDFETDTLCAPP